MMSLWMTATEPVTSTALDHLYFLPPLHQFKHVHTSLSQTIQVFYFKLFIPFFQRVIQIFSCKTGHFIQFSHYLLFFTFSLSFGLLSIIVLWKMSFFSVNFINSYNQLLWNFMSFLSLIIQLLLPRLFDRSHLLQFGPPLLYFIIS